MIKKFENQLKKITDDWAYSGSFMLVKEDKVIHHKAYGRINHDKDIFHDLNSYYTLDSYDKMFVNLAVLKAIDMGLISLSDTLLPYIPEYKHAELMTIENLLRDRSGIIDYYCQIIMVEQENDFSLADLSIEDRIRMEKEIKYKNQSFDQVFARIKDCPLEYEPGMLEKDTSQTNSVILAEIIERVSNKTLLEFIQMNIFEPLDLDICQEISNTSVSYVEYESTELVSVPLKFTAKGLFRVTSSNILRLLQAILRKEIISKSLWRKVMKRDKEGHNMYFNNASGYDFIMSEFLGFELYAYFDFKKQVMYSGITNAQQTFRLNNSNWTYFRREVRELVASLLTFPENTKMKRLNQNNLWGALNLSVDESQNQYVLETKSSIAMGLLSKSKRVFVQMEGHVAVGLLVLNLDKKHDNYNIDIVIIDRKFQNRGYGKLMVEWAVNYLKNEGASRLCIGVNRTNDAAKKIYMKAGFKAKFVTDEDMELEMIL